MNTDPRRIIHAVAATDPDTLATRLDSLAGDLEGPSRPGFTHQPRLPLQPAAAHRDLIVR